MASVVNVKVSTFTGERLPLDIDPDGSVSDLKNIVRDKTGEDRFRLGSKGKYLPDKKTLKEVGVGDGSEIWMARSVSVNKPARTQALGRTARGVQNGSIKHAIFAVGGELERAINNRANAIEDKLTENKVLAEATGENVSQVLHILKGGETPRGEQSDLARQKQIKVQKTALENERADLNERERKRKAAEKEVENRTIIDGAVLVKGAVQTAFGDVDSLQALDDKKKKVLKAVAERKRQLHNADDAVALTPKKPRKGSKAGKAAEAALALAAEEAAKALATDPAASDEESTLHDPVMTQAA